MKHIKKVFLFLFFLSFFFACKTTEANIYTIPQEEGQLIFLRPVDLVDKSFILQKATFDITVKIIDFSVTDENIVNYTLYFPYQYYDFINQAELFFSTDSESKISLENVKILYKDFDRKKNLEVRYSADISGEKVRKLLENPENSRIGLSIDNQTTFFNSKAFSQKLYELGVIIL